MLPLRGPCAACGKHFEFEEADKRDDFDTMFAMLSESEDMRDYLCYHMEMTRGVFGPYKIESDAAFTCRPSTRTAAN